MTLPYERKWAVDNTRTFLRDLLSDKYKVPEEVRKEAYRCLKHYPGEYYMDIAEEQLVEVFGTWDAFCKLELEKDSKNSS